MNKSGIFLLATILLASSCGKSENAQNKVTLKAANIINGVEVKTGNQYTRHTVGLVNRRANSICTGVIIEEDLILTAAHCLPTTAAPKIEIVFGNKLMGNSGIRMTAKNVIVHEGYHDKTHSNDVALIRLPKPVPADYAPVDLEASRQLVLNNGDSLTAVGYGVKDTGFFTKGRGILRMGNVKVENYKSDASLVSIYQGKVSSICFGDSGGPSFTLVENTPVLVGIASFVSSMAEKKKYICNYKAYLTNPNSTYSWIQSSKLKI